MAIYTSDSIFEKMEQQDFEVIQQNEWLQDLAAHIEKQIEPDNGRWKDERSEARQVECLPKEAKTIYYLWSFNVLAGGGGLDVFLDQAEVHIIKGSHQSLLDIGADKLAKYLSYAICIAMKNGDSYEFVDGAKNIKWFLDLSNSGKFDSIEDINDMFFEEFDVIEKLAIKFIQKNRDKLVE